jgi:hypothetical protein
MRRQRLWVVPVLIVGVACAIFIRRLAPRQLTSLELNVGNLPRIPTQPSSATLECTRGLEITMDTGNGEWSVIRDHPPCTVSGIALRSVKATATEVMQLNCSPLVVLQVAQSGLVSNASLVRSSGSTSLDERALGQVKTYRYPRHNCGLCKLSIPINVDFQGPVWIREHAPGRLSAR